MNFTAADNLLNPPEPQYIIIIRRGELLAPVNGDWHPIEISADVLPSPSHKHFLGFLDNQSCWVFFYDDRHDYSPPGTYEWVGLRSLLDQVSGDAFQLAGRALQVTRWHREHRYCGVCGCKTHPADRDRARICPRCNAHFYPRISPCVIGLVYRGKECLLAQGVRHKEGVYSTLAGFIEPGESAEQAFAREVNEEVGVAIKNIRYLQSQPWPFPGQLMLGFIAEYAGGDIAIDPHEIQDARWFSVDNLPTIPSPQTISGQIIHHFVQQANQYV